MCDFYFIYIFTICYPLIQGGDGRGNAKQKKIKREAEKDFSQTVSFLFHPFFDKETHALKRSPLYIITPCLKHTAEGKKKQVCLVAGELFTCFEALPSAHGTL